MFKENLKKIGIAALAVMMSGCFKTRLVIDVSKDATATGSMSVLMKESMLTMDGSTVEEALEEMKENYASEAEGEIETIREGDGDNAYAGIRISKVRIPEENCTIVKEGNKITVTVPLSDVQSEIMDETGGEEQGMTPSLLKELGAEATLTVNMPGKATSNLGTVNEKTVTVDLLSGEAREPLVVTCEVGVSPMIIAAVIVGTALLLGLAAYILSRRKKNI